ncbi:MAG: hypothetical protein V3U73_01790, partial [bacterium]
VHRGDAGHEDDEDPGELGRDLVDPAEPVAGVAQHVLDLDRCSMKPLWGEEVAGFCGQTSLKSSRESA